MREDPTAVIGTSGSLATALLSNINSVLSIIVGLASLGYVVTKWVILLRTRRDRD